MPNTVRVISLSFEEITRRECSLLRHFGRSVVNHMWFAKFPFFSESGCLTTEASFLTFIVDSMPTVCPRSSDNPP